MTGKNQSARLIFMANTQANNLLTVELKDTDLITVCDKCFQASCWQGEFYCEQYKTAGVVKMEARALRKLRLEHPHYWENEVRERKMLDLVKGRL